MPVMTNPGALAPAFPNQTYTKSFSEQWENRDRVLVRTRGDKTVITYQKRLSHVK